MWNVTDEVPKNCEIFVTCGGINLFLRRKKRFLESSELVKYVEDVGKFGNEECSDDKRNFTKPEHIRVCQKLTVE